MTDDSKPYTIHSDSRITLSPEAKYWAKEFGLSLDQMSRHILNQEKLRQSGLIQEN
jgi:hypothetical protein